MKSKKVDVRKIADTLRERCPFIMFAMLTGLDDDGHVKWLTNIELSVFIGSDTGNWYALEQILPVMEASIPEAFCDVTLLNRVDPVTRYRAMQGCCLFVQEGREHHYRQFRQHASLDYRVMRAQQRRLGHIDND